MQGHISVAAREIEAMEEADKRLQDSYHSLSAYIRVHRRCVDDKLEPTDGTILHTLWRKGQLTRQHLTAWDRWWRDLKNAAGKSAKLIGNYEGGVDGGGGGNDNAAYYGPGTYWTDGAYRVEEVWKRLRMHEKGLMEQLIRDSLRKEGLKDIHAHDLRYLGGALSGYNDDRQKISAGVSAVQRLLSSLAEIYAIPHFFD
jgi:hypothetical protein